MADLPPLTSSRNSSRAPGRQSSAPDLTESHLYIDDFIRETRKGLNFGTIQLPILDDEQLAELSDCETILVPLSCSALNALASMTSQLDTITTQLGTRQSIVATLPTSPALDSRLAPINASLRDLSQRVSAASHTQAPAPTQPRVPPAGATTRPAQAPTRPPVPLINVTRHTAPHHCSPGPRLAHPLQAKVPRAHSTQISPGMTLTPAPSTATPVCTRRGFPICRKPTRFVRAGTPTPPPSLLGT